jgi:GNAT superfamily N-acetyltransferase
VFGVTASRTDGLAVGMARVIGDTGVYLFVLDLFVVDVVVGPAEQDKGVGRLLMDRVKSWVMESGAPHVALVADPSVAGFCEPWGFREQAARYMRLSVQPVIEPGMLASVGQVRAGRRVPPDLAALAEGSGRSPFCLISEAADRFARRS